MFRPRTALGQKRPKLPWLPAAKSAVTQRVKFVPIPEVAGIENFSQNVNQFTLGRPGPAHRSPIRA
jgi:hypothetical protein